MDNKNFFSFDTLDSKGNKHSLSQYANNVVLVVNVASKCGFTPQYDGLEALYKKYKDQGLVVIGFPSNQFGSQEPGTNEEIQSFCRLNYGVTFPVMAKVDVNGDNASPVYKWLKSSAPGLLGTEMIKWNFTKFLIGRNGQVIERFAPATKPEDITPAIKKALESK